MMARMNRPKPLYHRRRFPAEVISHCVWLYFRLCLSYRDVEEIMAKRGVAVAVAYRDLTNSLWLLVLIALVKPKAS